MPGFSRTLSRVEARANGTCGRVGASQRRNCAEGFRANNPNRLTRADVSSWHITIFDCAAKIGRNRANGDRARAAVGPSWPRSLLSIARLHMARSRARPSIWSFVRIAQTCLGRSGAFAAVSLSLFQGTRLRIVWVGRSHDFAWSDSSVTEAEEHDPFAKALEIGRPSDRGGPCQRLV
jgi:hypothetical protein